MGATFVAWTRPLAKVAGALLDNAHRYEFWSENFFGLFNVVSCAMMFGPVVGLVGGLGSPIVPELVL